MPTQINFIYKYASNLDSITSIEIHNKYLLKIKRIKSIEKI